MDLRQYKKQPPYKPGEIKIVSDEQAEEIIRYNKRKEKVLKCIDWDEYTIDVSKIILQQAIQVGVTYSTVTEAARVTLDFVNQLKSEMMKTN